MKCEEVRKTLPLFLYGELSFDEEERVELHIDECAGCRKALEREKALFRSLDAAEAPTGPRFAERVPGGTAAKLGSCSTAGCELLGQDSRGLYNSLPLRAGYRATRRRGSHARPGFCRGAHDCPIRF